MGRFASYKERYAADRSIFESKVAWRKANREYAVWRQMVMRCTNPKAMYYLHYGGRGITVCDRWVGENGYKNFLLDMGKRPTSKHSIDRKNNELGYFPDNCHWATKIHQARNSRKNIRYVYLGKEQCLAEIAESTGIRYGTLYSRVVLRGMPIERAVGA